MSNIIIDSYPFLQGLGIGFSLIIAIGMQNAFVLKQGNSAKTFALFASIATLAIALVAVFTPGEIGYDAAWLNNLGSRITLKADGMAKMLSLLTAVSFPLIFTAVYNNEYKNSASFYGLMLLSQAGLMGVFLASDALLFYFFLLCIFY